MLVVFLIWNFASAGHPVAHDAASWIQALDVCPNVCGLDTAVQIPCNDVWHLIHVLVLLVLVLVNLFLLLLFVFLLVFLVLVSYVVILLFLSLFLLLF